MDLCEFQDSCYTEKILAQKSQDNNNDNNNNRRRRKRKKSNRKSTEAIRVSKRHKRSYSILSTIMKMQIKIIVHKSSMVVHV